MIPVIEFNQDAAERAYEAHKALLIAERAAPMLRNIPSFTMAKQDAYEAFVRAFARF